MTYKTREKIILEAKKEKRYGPRFGLRKVLKIQNKLFRLT